MWETIINNRQKRVRRRRKALFAGAVLLALAAAATDTASAAPVPGPIPVVAESNAIHDPADTIDTSVPTVELDFDGARPGSEEIRFTMDRVIVPGDQITRSVDIKNAAGADGILTIAISAQQQETTDPGGGNLADDLELVWTVGEESGSIAVAELLDGNLYEIARVPVTSIETVTAVFSIKMDETVTGHNRGTNDAAAIVFTALATLSPVEDGAPSPTGGPTPTGQPSPTSEPSTTGAPTPSDRPSSEGPPTTGPSVTGEPSETPTNSEQPPITSEPPTTEPPSESPETPTTTPPSQSGITGVLTNTGTAWKFAALSLVLLSASAGIWVRRIYGGRNR